jgi:tRNA modification GTPase
MRRARARADAADLVLWIIDRTQPAELSLRPKTGGATTWLIGNKSDLQSAIIKNPEHELLNIDFHVSAITGAGVGALLDALGKFAEQFFGSTESALITRSRQRANVVELSTMLGRIIGQPVAYNTDHIDVLAEELRLAGRAIGRLTGRIDVEDVLDVIFRDFCIGK